MSENLQNFAKFQKCQLDILVDFEKCCKTHIYFQRSVPIQPKTSHIFKTIALKFATTLPLRSDPMSDPRSDPTSVATSFSVTCESVADLAQLWTHDRIDYCSHLNGLNIEKRQQQQRGQLAKIDLYWIIYITADVGRLFPPSTKSQ